MNHWASPRSIRPAALALKVDERRETSMPGIYAAGDLANPLMPSVTLASSMTM
jgi:thioredoxin reductase